VTLWIATPPAADFNQLPAGLEMPSRNKRERVEWLMASVYCPCGMHDECAGHFLTLAACNSGTDNPCGMARRLRKEFAERIDKGLTDQQIIENLVKSHGPKLLCPHMLP
jgi:cytochrome c-type biogenesis protein CcmH/NrfF